MPWKSKEEYNAYRREYNKRPERKEYHRLWQQLWRKNNPDRWKSIYKKSHKKNYEKYKDRKNTYLRNYTKKLRLLLIEKYGGKCACCGESNYNFLSIDHINGDGVAHRKHFHGSTRELYRDLANKDGGKKFEIQILSFNCNMGRQFNGGKNKICPHKMMKK